MTLILETDGDFADTLALDLPVGDAAVFALFGGSRTQSARNLANPDLPFSVIGTPGIAANYVDCDSINFFDTRVRDSESDTVFFVSKRPAAALGDFGRIYGNLQNRLSYQDTNDKALYSVINTASGNKLYQRPTDASVWRLHAARWTQNSGIRLWDFTAAPIDGNPISANDALVRVFGQQTIAVGSANNASAADRTKTAVQVACFGYYQRRLEDADVLTVAAFIRTLMAARGIAV